jgi:asparagine synthase (glutamine-hydrolysing)
MCGIVGVWQRGDKEPNIEVIEKMAEVLQHRGPDDSGLEISGDIGLAHRRLSIIDLSSAGKQPMAAGNGRYSLVFNGEIYNHKELRDKYCGDVKFNSTSDTEVLLHILISQGIRVLSEIKGMFALALWDKEERELLLARDPFGKKPLYYFKQGDLFLFASEIKSILQHPEYTQAIDPKAAVRYLAYEYIPAPETGYEGIHQLPMGSYAKVKSSGDFEIKQWWRPQFQPKNDISFEDAKAKLDELLEQAVRRRMVADVPVGILLSGGLDSTTIAWYMKKVGATDLRSFSVSFDENYFDESAYAQQAAHAVGCEHTNRQFNIDTFKEYLNKSKDMMDIPFGDSSQLPTWYICDVAREKVKVVLDGDGSDELMGGYGIFQAAETAEKLPNLPRGWWALAEKIIQGLPTSFDYFSFDFKAKTFLKGLGLDLPLRHQVWMGSFNTNELKGLLTDEYYRYIKNVYSATNTDFKTAKANNSFDKISLLTIQDYLQNDILVKLDRASMFASLEARTPFLDTDLAEFIMKLPTEMKHDKKILRSLMRGRIPDSIIDRKKQGFALPLGHWLREDLYDWAKDTLAKPSPINIYKPKEALRLLEEHKRGRRDNRKKLWTLLMLKMWQDKWLV